MILGIFSGFLWQRVSLPTKLWLQSNSLSLSWSAFGRFMLSLIQQVISKWPPTLFGGYLKSSVRFKLCSVDVTGMFTHYIYCHRWFSKCWTTNCWILSRGPLQSFWPIISKGKSYTGLQIASKRVGGHFEITCCIRRPERPKGDHGGLQLLLWYFTPS